MFENLFAILNKLASRFRELLRMDKNKQIKFSQSRGNFELYDWTRTLVGTVLAVVLVFTFAARIMLVDGESMRETLQNGDGLLIVNAQYCGVYRPNDIVIVRKASFYNGKPIVKRVIATAGQTVDIDFDNGSVCVDGQELVEPYIRDTTHLQEGPTFPLTVPVGCVFVMGDNRNDSDDSRDPALGVVDTRYIIGRAVFLVFPGKTAELDKMEFSRIGSLA